MRKYGPQARNKFGDITNTLTLPQGARILPRTAEPPTVNEPSNEPSAGPMSDQPYKDPPEELKRALDLHREWLEDHTRGQRLTNEIADQFDWTGLMLDGVSFEEAELEMFEITGSSLRRSSWRGATLSESRFFKNDLMNSTFDDADLRAATIHSNNLNAETASFTGARLEFSHMPFLGRRRTAADIVGIVSMEPLVR